MQLNLIDPNFNTNGIKINNLVQSVIEANLNLYKKNGFQKPWGAYLAVQENIVLGTCAFKSSPQNGRVEIAYFTFPENEKKGIATEMAKELIHIAKSHDPKIKIFAQTLPEENISTKILAKLGFTKTKSIQHPEDGDVWEWELILQGN